jgi:hypothetical protein
VAKRRTPEALGRHLPYRAATNSVGDVHFHLINPKTNNRTKMITIDTDTSRLSDLKTSLLPGLRQRRSVHQRPNRVKLDN